MKTKLLTLFSLLALLLVSTAVLADGRPTGIRIGRAVSGGGTNVQIDITVPSTDVYYSGGFSTSVWIGNSLKGGSVWQYTSAWTPTAFVDPLPRAIEWGDGYNLFEGQLFGPPGGPYRGTFSHTYVDPGSYIITVGDAVCCNTKTAYPFGPPTTGNAVTGYTRHGYWTFENTAITWAYDVPQTLAITNTATVHTGTGIPTLNIYGLLAMAFVLVGTGILLFRKPTVA